MASSSQGEMNPFISYVDLFSSVILVLLLFVLLMLVNVGYYMQKNTKVDANQTVISNEDAKLLEQLKEEAKTRLETKKAEPIITQNVPEQVVERQTEPAQETPEETFEGNTVYKNGGQLAVATFIEADMVVAYKNNEFFLNKDITMDIIGVLKRIQKANPNVTFVLTIGDSKKIISSSQTKQVSLGRILSLKNNIEAVPELKGRTKINYKPTEKLNYEYGYIKIESK